MNLHKMHNAGCWSGEALHALVYGDENGRRATLQRYRPGVDSSLTVPAGSAQNCCFRRWNFHLCLQLSQTERLFPFIPNLRQPRSLVISFFLKKITQIQKPIFHLFPPNLPDRTTVPVHPHPRQPRSTVISFVLTMPHFSNVLPLTTILTWASMGGNYMINVW